MGDLAGISGTFADFKLIKTRSAAQIIVEIPIEDADRVLTALGGVPQPGKEKHVAIARMDVTTPKPEPQETAEKVPGEVTTPREFSTLSRAQQAGILCNEGGFHKWLRAVGDMPMNAFDETFEQQAATAVRHRCGVNSRAVLDTNQDAARIWDRMVVDYRNWPGFVK